MKNYMLYALVFFLVFTTNCYSEDCWMTGTCFDRVGYVFLPECQYRGNWSVVTLNGVKYKVDSSLKVFKEKGLPRTGSIATINTSYHELLPLWKFKEDINVIKNTLKKWQEEKYNNKTKIVTFENIDFGIGNRLEGGTKVQILGYRLVREFIPEIHYSPDHLMVMVQVVSEPGDEKAKEDSPSATPSFDCKKANSQAEKLICSSKDLSDADLKLNSAYKNALSRTSDKASLKKDQLEWSKQIRDVCTDVPCMLKAYEKRTQELMDMSKSEK